MEVGESLLPGILLVEAVIINNFFFGLSDDWEYVWFAIVVSVSSHSQIDLEGIGVRPVSGTRDEDGVWRALRHVGETEVYRLVLFLRLIHYLQKICMTSIKNHVDA